MRDYVAEFQLTPAHIPELIRLAAMWADPQDDWPEDGPIWAPVHAWRALAQLGAVEAVTPLLEMSSDLHYDDWQFEDFPHVFALIGAGAIPPLKRHAADRAK